MSGIAQKLGKQLGKKLDKQFRQAIWTRKEARREPIDLSANFQQTFRQIIAIESSTCDRSMMQFPRLPIALSSFQARVLGEGQRFDRRPFISSSDLCFTKY